MTRLKVHGLGIALPIGLKLTECFDSLMNHKSATCFHETFLNRKKRIPISRCDWARINSYLEELDLDLPWDLMPMTGLAFYAVDNAIKNAQASGYEFEKHQTGVYLGTSTGNITNSNHHIKNYYHGIRPPVLSLIHGMNCFAATEIAKYYKITGPNYTISSSCVSSNQALNMALMDLENNRVKTAIVVGADSSIIEPLFINWSNMRILSNIEDEKTLCRPFCKTRSGTAYSEGSVALILSKQEDGNLRIWGPEDYTWPQAGLEQSSESMYQCMTKVLEAAQINPLEIDFVHANAGGGEHMDLYEAQAIHKIFNNNQVPVYGSKSLMGNTLGAYGLISLVLSILIFDNRRLPTNAHIFVKDNVIDDCINCYYEKPIERKMHKAFLNSFGFGGVNSSMIIEYETEVDR